MKLIYKHNRVKSLSWTIAEYNNLLKMGELKNNCYDLVFRIIILSSFKFDIVIKKSSLL